MARVSVPVETETERKLRRWAKLILDPTATEAVPRFGPEPIGRFASQASPEPFEPNEIPQDRGFAQPPTPTPAFGPEPTGRIGAPPRPRSFAEQTRFMEAESPLTAARTIGLSALRLLELSVRPFQASGALLGAATDELAVALGGDKGDARRRAQNFRVDVAKVQSGEMSVKELAGRLVESEEQRPILEQMIGETPAFLLGPGAARLGFRGARAAGEAGFQAGREAAPTAQRILAGEAGGVGKDAARLKARLARSPALRAAETRVELANENIQQLEGLVSTAKNSEARANFAAALEQQKALHAEALREVQVAKGEVATGEIKVGDVITTKIQGIGIQPIIGQVVSEGTYSTLKIPAWRIQTGPGKFTLIPKEDAKLLTSQKPPAKPARPAPKPVAPAPPAVEGIRKPVYTVAEGGTTTLGGKPVTRWDVLVRGQPSGRWFTSKAEAEAAAQRFEQGAANILKPGEAPQVAAGPGASTAKAVMPASSPAARPLSRKGGIIPGPGESFESWKGRLTEDAVARGIPRIEAFKVSQSDAVRKAFEHFTAARAPGEVRPIATQGATPPRLPEVEAVPSPAAQVRPRTRRPVVLAKEAVEAPAEMRMRVPPQELLADAKAKLAAGVYHPSREPLVRKQIAELEREVAGKQPTTAPVKPAEAVAANLKPLVAEAIKYESFDDFSSAYLRGVSGRYWHITDNPQFTIRKGIVPREMAGPTTVPGPPGLMVSNDPAVWVGQLPKRGYAVEVDLSKARPGIDYTLVNRGFGNEIFIFNVEAVTAKKPVSLNYALREAKQYFDVLPDEPQKLRAIWESAREVSEAAPAKAVAPEVPPTTAVKTPAQATAQVKAVQKKGQQAPETVAPQDAREAHVEMGSPDGPRPPRGRPPTAKGEGPPPDDSAETLRQIAAKATTGERPDQTLLRRHEAAISVDARRTSLIVQEGKDMLRAAGIGVMRGGHLVPRPQDIPRLDALLNALHNPSRVAAGEIKVPQGLEAAYQRLRGLTDWEEAARLDFDPAMATVTDYFYRGWKPPKGAVAGISQGRPLVKTPAFKKARVDATYQEMRDAGFEPLSWNPFEQWRISRGQGNRYREQMALVDALKSLGDDFLRPHAGGPIPPGWRVPEVGPAFEGKPFATVDALGEPAVMFTRRWIAPNKIANSMENIYGKRPDLGKLTVAGRDIDPLAVVDFLTFVPKRAKLTFSLFQQVDFLNRGGAGSWSRMADALLAGQPVEAVRALAKYPESAATIVRANFSPSFRRALAQQLDSTEPLIAGRPGVHMKGIGEAGLSTFDPAMFRWEEMDKMLRSVADEVGMLGQARKVARLVGDLEGAMRRGLFNGVYPAAMMTDIKNNVAPMMARMYPKLNDEQLMGQIAREVNKKYSSIPASQSVLQNRVLRETLRRVFFSVGESEGLLRSAASALGGPSKKFWAKNWLGTYLFLIATAAAIHYAATGKPLPVERYTPISKDKWGPLPFGYNTRFASPTLPLEGRGGTAITLDIVGQMDTALRILNPLQFLSSRESVLIRALVNQVSGSDFFGNPIDDVGPGGVVSRTVQLAEDMFAPIGAGGITKEVARRNIPGAEQVITEGETRLGMTGLGVQATGLNLRADTREMRLQSKYGEKARVVLKGLEALELGLGYVSKNFDTELGVKGGEIKLTSEQREQLQWLTDDAIIEGLQDVLASPEVQALTEEQRKEHIQAVITNLRAQARADFRATLGGQAPTGAPTPGEAEPPRRSPANSMYDIMRR